mmetsp:Transcript_3272/g.5501  ORF Transcript_3272/g.5501 Transcript_3272/m.5501 type:complete len:351 (-) Transcript_3272:488-1540(-)
MQASVAVLQLSQHLIHGHRGTADVASLDALPQREDLGALLIVVHAGHLVIAHQLLDSPVGSASRLRVADEEGSRTDPRPRSRGGLVGASKRNLRARILVNVHEGSRGELKILVLQHSRGRRRIVDGLLPRIVSAQASHHVYALELCFDFGFQVRNVVDVVSHEDAEDASVPLACAAGIGAPHHRLNLVQSLLDAAADLLGEPLPGRRVDLRDAEDLLVGLQVKQRHSDGLCLHVPVLYLVHLALVVRSNYSNRHAAQHVHALPVWHQPHESVRDLLQVGLPAWRGRDEQHIRPSGPVQVLARVEERLHEALAGRILPQLCSLARLPFEHRVAPLRRALLASHVRAHEVRP